MIFKKKWKWRSFNTRPRIFSLKWTIIRMCFRKSDSLCLHLLIIINKSNIETIILANKLMNFRNLLCIIISHLIHFHLIWSEIYNFSVLNFNTSPKARVLGCSHFSCTISSWSHIDSENIFKINIISHIDLRNLQTVNFMLKQQIL